MLLALAPCVHPRPDPGFTHGLARGGRHPTSYFSTVQCFLQAGLPDTELHPHPLLPSSSPHLPRLIALFQNIFPGFPSPLGHHGASAAPWELLVGLDLHARAPQLVEVTGSWVVEGHGPC